MKDLDEDDDTNEIKSRDQFLFNTLTALKKILQHCNIARKMIFRDNMNGIWGMFEICLRFYINCKLRSNSNSLRSTSFLESSLNIFGLISRECKSASSASSYLGEISGMSIIWPIIRILAAGRFDKELGAKGWKEILPE